MPRAFRPVPPEFAALAATQTSAWLCERFSTGAAQIARWRRECRVPPKGFGHFERAPLPEKFAELAPTMTRHAAAAFFGRHPDTVARLARENGITFRQNVTVISARRPSKVHDTARDMSRAGQAAEFLLKFGPVFRCNGTGQPDAKGDHWRRGTTTLTADEIIARAERNGWRPDAWKQLSTPHHEGARA